MIRAVLLVIVAIILPITIHDSAGASAASTPIQHVIILVQENHSFDSYFGTYPTANGTLVDATTSQIEGVNGIPNHVCLPYSQGCISPQLTTSQEPSNPEEGQATYEMDYSNNATGFPTFSGPQSMVYFDYHSLAAYWNYAEEYGLADNYYSAALSTTTPNRLMLLAGDTSVSANYGPPPYLPYSETVMSQLDKAAITWGYYDYIDTYGNASNLYPLNYFSAVPQSALANTRAVDSLFQELAGGSGLPSVSFVNSLGRPEFTEHPPYSPSAGEFWIVSIINKIMESTYWPSTAIFLTWDEGGGYYDHVDPPNLFTTTKNFTRALVGLGQRVPLLVISSYAKTGFVSHVQLSHLSLPHMIEYLWNLPPLNSLVADSNLPLEFFDFSQEPRTPIILGPTVEYPLPKTGNLAPTAPDETQNGLFLSALVVLSVLIVRTLKPSPKNREDRYHRENRNSSYCKP